jgi:halimadienyl-diphosphate synthase
MNMTHSARTRKTAVTSGVPGSGVDISAATRELLAGLHSKPWGQISPSVYETGRLVTLAPSLTGHTERVEFLISNQRPDGGWGGWGPYALVPTLSATEALLTTVRDVESAVRGVDYPRLVDTAAKGLHALFGWLHSSRMSIPDTPGVELIVPRLVHLINLHLDQLNESPLSGLDMWNGRGRLHPPTGMDDTSLVTFRRDLARGVGLPSKLLHALEVAGDGACNDRSIRPAAFGTIGASPAATAAWLGRPGLLDPNNPATRYLESVVSEYGGPVPCGVPVTTFERSWVLSGLARAGVRMTEIQSLVASLRNSLSETGASAGAGLPPDCDTTAVTLFALSQLGHEADLECLQLYESETHFCTWQGEQGVSTSVNAHVLDAFGHAVAGDPETTARHAATVAKLSGWLCDQQLPDGSWSDRWHASPYYATVCCSLALDQFGHADSVPAVRRAVKWVLGSQRPDGSWGRWFGTLEETSYAMQMLLLTRWSAVDEVREAAAAGYRYLLRSIDDDDQPALWHDKDIYLPSAIVRAAVLAALRMAQRDLPHISHRL